MAIKSNLKLTNLVHLVLFTSILSVGTMSCTKKSSEETEKQAAGEKKADAPQAKKEKVLNWVRWNDPKSLDPMRQFDGASADIVSNVYDRLMEYSYLERPYKLEPALLSEMPETINKEKTKYRFKLRKGVKFIDDACFPNGKGRELTADDVIYSIHRFSDANVNVLSYFLMKGMIKGGDSFRENSRKQGKELDYAKTFITGIEKVDSHTFTIELTAANPLFMYAFGAPALSIVPKEAVDYYGKEFEWHPVGTGAYYIKDFKKRQTLTFYKNPNYFQNYPEVGESGDKDKGLLASAGKSIPFIDRVEYHYIPEPQPRMLQFLSGKIDWVRFDRENFQKMADKNADGTFTLKKEHQGKLNIHAAPTNAVEYLEFNMKDKVVGTNPNLRKAIAHALNKQKTVDLLYNGRYHVVDAFIPLGIAGNEKDLDFKYHEYNVEKAKEYLAKAGYPGGKGLKPITIDFRSTSAPLRREAEAWRADLAKIGINIIPQFQTFAAFLQKTETSNFQIAHSAWSADYPDAENFFQLIYGPNQSPGPNSGMYSNPKYDELYERAKLMSNGTVRFELFKRMLEIVKEDTPVVPTFNVVFVELTQKKLKNFKIHAIEEVAFKYWDLEEDGKDAQLRN